MTAVLAAGLIAALPVAGCSTTESATKATDAASGTTAADAATAVTMTDQWVKAADSGMTAVFGTLKNSGKDEMTVVSATSPAAGRMELHEVVGQQGAKTMRPKEGGFAIPAGGTHVLAPGGDHLMLMDLKAPLAVGSDVEVTLTFQDGSTLPFTAQVRTFAGADENYQPGGSAGQHG